MKAALDYNPQEIQIMVIDDASFSRKTISQILSDYGFNVVGDAANAEEANSVLQNNSVDIIIMDVVMPDTNGISLANEITNHYKDIFIIMASSLAQEHVIIEAIAAGAVDFIQKPFKPNVLIDSVDKVARQVIQSR